MKAKGEKGRYESPLADYPGFVQFPYPLTETHFSKWWGVAIDPIKNMGPLEWARVNFEWEGAKLLVSEFGQWGIDGVAIGEVKQGNCPLDLMEWVVICASDYVFPKLSPRLRARIQGI